MLSRLSLPRPPGIMSAETVSPRPAKLLPPKEPVVNVGKSSRRRSPTSSKVLSERIHVVCSDGRLPEAIAVGLVIETTPPAN